MTRKDYIKIADALIEGFIRSEIKPHQRDIIVWEISQALGRDNARFDNVRFADYIRNSALLDIK